LDDIGVECFKSQPIALKTSLHDGMYLVLLS